VAAKAPAAGAGLVAPGFRAEVGMNLKPRVLPSAASTVFSMVFSAKVFSAKAFSAKAFSAKVFSAKAFFTRAFFYRVF
jgi:hypothetical protein